MKHFLLTSFAFSLLFLFSNTDSNFATKSIEGDPIPCVEKTFPIAFHVIEDSLGNKVSNVAINNVVNNLNNLFEPVCMDFSVDTIHTIYNHSFDILNLVGEKESMINLHNIPYRINVYIGTTMGTSIFEPGFGTFEGITQNTNLNPAIGVDIDAFVLSNTFAHYMGVYFGLVPTSDITNGLELVDGSNCDVAGDGLCDTPADPFEGILDSSYYSLANCRFIHPGKDANNQFYNPDISNIMSYYYRCRCTFTKSQYRIMAQTYLSSPGNTW